MARATATACEPEGARLRHAGRTSRHRTASLVASAPQTGRCCSGADFGSCAEAVRKLTRARHCQCGNAPHLGDSLCSGLSSHLGSGLPIAKCPQLLHDAILGVILDILDGLAAGSGDGDGRGCTEEVVTGLSEPRCDAGWSGLQGLRCQQLRLLTGPYSPPGRAQEDRQDCMHARLGRLGQVST